MPTCCTPFETVFANVTSTTIAYTPELKALYSNRPRVYVYYHQEDGTFLLSPFFTVMKIIGDNIVIDHGGPSSGVIIVT